MQQTQNKNEASTKKSNSFGKMMLQRDKNRFQMKEKQAYFELLKAPRGKEYFLLLGKMKESAERLKKIEEEIAKLTQEIEQESETVPATGFEAEQKTENFAPQKSLLDWTVGTSQNNMPNWATGASKSNTVPWAVPASGKVNVLQRIEEKMQKRLQLQIERNKRLEEYQKAQQAFLEQLPVPEKLYDMLYPGENEAMLIQYGVLYGPGVEVPTPEIMFQYNPPKTENEKKQRIKGHHLCTTYYNENLLLVEIYEDVVCVVFKDGSVITVE